MSQCAENTRRKGKRKQEKDEESSNAYDSDDLDNESAVEILKARQTKTRQAKKRKVNNQQSEVQLEKGQEFVGVVVEAPKTGLVPPGQISKNTFDFLGKLNKVECNDRAW